MRNSFVYDTICMRVYLRETIKLDMKRSKSKFITRRDLTGRPNMSTIPILPSISKFAENYDAWFCDIWGVIHNGRDVFETATQACQTFKEKGGYVVLISNAPRPSYSVEEQFGYFGITSDMYDKIITSGDVTRALIKSHANLPMFHLGPHRDRPILDGLNVTLTSAEKAQVVLCTGLFDDETETPEDYRTMLEDFHARNVPMICANPDIKVERGNALVYCAGALAEAFGHMNGKVLYAGKPYAPIYNEASAQLKQLSGKPIAKSRILCIGDGLYTDIAGAENNGFASVYIASGLHMGQQGSDFSPVMLKHLFRNSSSPPIAAQDHLKW